MAIYCFCQIKGGVGKTTLAVNMAIERVIRGKRDVLLVDADSQHTATDFGVLRADVLGTTGFTAIQLSDASLRTQILSQRGKYDDIVIDVGGRDTVGLRAALTVADIAIIPFQPRSFDVWTLEKMAELVREGRAFNPGMDAVGLLNLADPQGDDNAEAAKIIGKTADIGYLDAPIGRRKSFGNAAGSGLSVLEMKNRDGKACNELKYMIDMLVARAARAAAVIAEAV